MNIIKIAIISLLSITHTALSQDCVFIEDQRIGWIEYTYGGDVAIDNDVAVVAARDTTSVFVYRHNGSEWVLEGNPSGNGLEITFGHTVDLHNEMLVIGIPHAYDSSIQQSGAARIYRFDGTDWLYEHTLQPDDIVVQDEFGIFVAASEDVIAVVAGLRTDNIRTYIYRFDGNQWQHEQTIPLETIFGSSIQSWPTDSVALDNDTLVIGSYEMNMAAIYEYQDGVWTFDQTLESTNVQEYGFFGISVAVRDDLIVVGALEDNYPEDKPDIVLGTGTAIVYQNINGEWIEQQRIIPSDGRTQDQFGRSVAISDESMIVITAPRHDGSGKAYVYTHNGMEWVEDIRLVPTTPNNNYNYGHSVAADNGKIIVTETALNNSIGAGYAYFYNYDPEGCLADLTMDCTLDFFDISVFLTYYQLKNTNADFTGDGVYDFFDVSAFLTSFSSGCP
ncbi:MAG: GC-type dockerin domain-anchored protein [Phycisphaerales bacterium]